MNYFSVIGILCLLTTFTYFTHPQPTFCKHQSVPWIEDLGALLFIYFFLRCHLSVSSPFSCAPVRLVHVLVGPGSVTLSTFHAESWLLCENDHSVDGYLGKMGMWSPPTACHGADSPRPGVWLWGTSTPISKVCGHSLMTLFPTIMIMDITFDKHFIN